MCQSSKPAFPLLAAIAVIISCIAEIVDRTAEIVEHVAILLPLAESLAPQVQLLDPAHPFIRIMLLVVIGLALAHRTRVQVLWRPEP